MLPTYNEVDNVGPLIHGILGQDDRIEVVVVDDGSPDGTGDVVAALAAEDERVGLIRRSGKLGLGSAYCAGFDHALERGYDAVFTMDCDFSHDPSEIPAMLAAGADHDLVIGSRYVPGGAVENWGIGRRFLSRFANWYTRFLLRLPVRDCTSGYRCYRAATLRESGFHDIRASGYSFLEEMVWRVHHRGATIFEHPITFADRRFGQSKIDRKEIFRAAVHVLTLALRRRRAGSG